MNTSSPLTASLRGLGLQRVLCKEITLGSMNCDQENMSKEIHRLPFVTRNPRLSDSCQDDPYQIREHYREIDF